MKGFTGFILWCVIFMAPLATTAQGEYSISGIVLDAKTNKPIALANVYFNGTTIGAATDENGRYSLPKVSLELKELYISCIGYKTLRVQLAPPEGENLATVNVKLLPTVIDLAPVTITVRRDWAQRYRVFERVFLGATSNASMTSILNPEVLSFKDIEGEISKKDFKAVASAPILIENRALGYNLSVSMENFTTVGNNYEIVSSTRFTEMKPRNDREARRWKQNRLDAYKGSQLHLFRSIANGRYEQEGFRIFSVRRPADTVYQEYQIPAPIEAVVVDSSSAHPKILRKGTYVVEYYNKVVPLGMRDSPKEYFPHSTIKVNDDYLQLYPNGQVVQPSDFWRLGYLYNFRFGDLLPFDYDPVIEEGQLTLMTRRELTTIRGKVVDERGEPLSSAEVFINAGLTHAQTNAWGQFELSGLDPGKYSLGIAYDGKKTTLKAVDIMPGDSTFVTVKMEDQVLQTVSGNSIVDNEKRVTYTRAFWARLFNGLGRLNFVITNPQVLQFSKHGKTIDVWTTAPLVVEDTRFGFQWTYFISHAAITGKAFTIDAIIKMDTLRSESNYWRSHWRNNRTEAYLGSWNHLVSSIFDGRSPTEGFHFYQVKSKFHRRRPRFSKLKQEVIAELDPDSLLVFTHGRVLLRIPPGLEVHNKNRKATRKVYKGVTDEVLRLAADSSMVTMAYCGSFNPNELTITGADEILVPTVPRDYRFRTSRTTDPEVFVYVQEENLKAAKNMLEKVYVHTDKPYYHPGDTLWFKAYLRYANPLFRDSLSRVLYAELLSPKGELLANTVLKINGGMTWGDIAVPGGLMPGDYYLRVYTRWMQNFNEFFIASLPIVARNTFIEPIIVNNTEPSNEELTVSLTTDMPQYNTGQPIGLGLEVLRDGAPVAASFSVSVIDQSAVSNIEGGTDIYSLRKPFKAENADIIRLTHAPERGITLQGIISPSRDDTRHVVSALLLNSQQHVVDTTNGPSFTMVLDFADTTTALFQSFGPNDTPAKVEIMEQPAVRSIELPKPLRYRIATGATYDRLTTTRTDSATILREVTIGAMPIRDNTRPELTSTQRSFGMAYQIMEGPDLANVRLTGNLLDFLSQKLPQFRETYCWIAYRGPCAGGAGTPGARTFMETYSPTGIMQNTAPQYTYDFYLDGVPLDLFGFESIPASMVSRIEVYWTPDRWDRDRVAIFTEPNVPYRRDNFQLYLVRGFDTPHRFIIPDAKSPMPDYRSTIYWNPDGRTEVDGSATISFLASDVDGTYKVTIEGMTDDGECFRTIKYLEIER